MLHSKGHGRKSARDKTSISKERKERPSKAARSKSKKKVVVVNDQRKDISLYADEQGHSQKPAC